MSQLPFLRKKDAGGIATQISVRKSDKSAEPEEKDDGSDGLMACAQDLLQAIQANDPKGLADAFKAAFEICEMYPTEESAEPVESNEEMG